MAKRKVVEQPRIKFDDVHGYVEELFQGDIHSKRVLSLANATHGVMTSGSLVIHAIGKGLSQAKGLLTKHAIKQVDPTASECGWIQE